MARGILGRSIFKAILSELVFSGATPRNPRKILVVAAWAMVCAWMQAPVALAQRGAHPAGGARAGGGAPVAAPRVAVPPITHAMIPRPRGVAAPAPRAVGTPVSLQRLRFRPGPIRGFRPAFFGPRFRFGRGLRFRSLWWPGCGPVWGWEFGCSGMVSYPTGFENYVAAQSYENPSYVYGYGSEGRDLIWLYLKDGTVFGVSDYWFVNGEVHFEAVGEGGVPSGEQMIGVEELDAQKTSDVNTTRGFRVVMRDEPWQKYLKDHPDLTPPPLVAPREK
jgi:hypothetical protein